MRRVRQAVSDFVGDNPSREIPMLYQWFATSARRHASRTALEVDGERFSYQQLAEMAEALAALICREMETVPGRIGLLAGRSVLAYAGYLAIQRLGKSVVPLNPAFPGTRIQYMLTNSGTGAVLADPRLRLAPGAGVRLMPVDPARLVDGSRASLPPLPEAPESEAYLLFTSGSTGAPKGVPIRQRNVSAFLKVVQDRYGIEPGARCSQSFDLTFDPSVFDLFATWSAGATLVVPSRNDLLRPVRFINDNGLTHWYSVPSVISRAEASGRLVPGSMPALRHSMFSGEALTARQARAWKGAAPASTLTNCYGPTEVTINCTEFTLPADPGDWPVTPNDVVPIGRPYPGLDCAVLDESGRPAPDGELCVRGTQRFAGYLDLAANHGRFHPEPAVAGQPVPSSSWYRTGDRVTIQDGNLHFHGRTDQQVKINGYRVELGEIEAALRSLAGVTDAVVVTRHDATDVLELYALCLGPAPEPALLRAELADRLPGYMVPRRVLTVDHLPYNANGKIDRRAAADLVTSALQR
jgi:amino acid adenylation domain-containing protein